ncbi:phosphoribosylanthranilate isomerase [bacterium]|nr:phosphoribosylanthranilate isomerase [bacterium]
MEAITKPRIKICCIGSIEEAQMAIRAGASALGLVSAMPSGPGVIADERIVQIAAAVPPPVATFLLTSKQNVAEIIFQQRRLRTNTIQICDRIKTGSYHDLREALPGVKLVQVIHVTGEESIDEALAAAPHVDAILLDSGNQNLAVKELGGTGRRHDWRISRVIRERLPIPMFLAGGLNPSNVREAIDAVGPFGLDVCSGVRTNGQLDLQKLQAFFKAAHE